VPGVDRSRPPVSVGSLWSSPCVRWEFTQREPAALARESSPPVRGGSFPLRGPAGYFPLFVELFREGGCTAPEVRGPLPCRRFSLGEGRSRWGRHSCLPDRQECLPHREEGSSILHEIAHEHTKRHTDFPEGLLGPWSHRAGPARTGVPQPAGWSPAATLGSRGDGGPTSWGYNTKDLVARQKEASVPA
jgi:hypothetical protein